MENNYMEIHMLNQQMQQLQQHLQQVEAQFNELQHTKQALEDLKDCKPGSEMLGQVATGMFVKSELKDNTKVILNIGADTGVEKSMHEANDLVERQLRQIVDVREHFITQLNQLQTRLMELQNV
jgi:prefoldin alpha subunit